MNAILSAAIVITTADVSVPCGPLPEHATQWRDTDSPW